MLRDELSWLHAHIGLPNRPWEKTLASEPLAGRAVCLHVRTHAHTHTPTPHRPFRALWDAGEWGGEGLTKNDASQAISLVPPPPTTTGNVPTRVVGLLSVCCGWGRLGTCSRQAGCQEEGSRRLLSQTGCQPWTCLQSLSSPPPTPTHLSFLLVLTLVISLTPLGISIQDPLIPGNSFQPLTWETIQELSFRKRTLPSHPRQS